MSFHYDFATLKEAILFNTTEVLPSNMEQLDREIQALVENANSSSEPIRHYIGFEISGQIHFPGSVYQMMNVAELQKAGVECILWMADYHTWINKKLDGKIETIRKVAREYFEPIFRKSLEIAGGDPDKLLVLYAEDEYFKKNENGLSFWDYEFEIERNITLSRILRSLSVAGKTAGESTDYQLTRYPGMQAADIFWHGTHIVQGGLDQRKIYVLARDNAFNLDQAFQLKMGQKSVKPIILFTQLLLGLEKPVAGNFTLDELETQSPTLERSLEILATTQSEITLTENGQVLEHDETVIQDLLRVNLEAQNKAKEVNKMSKSKPDSAIWVHDSFEEILRKLKKAYCPGVDWSGGAEHIWQKIIEEKKRLESMLIGQGLFFTENKYVIILELSTKSENEIEEEKQFPEKYKYKGFFKNYLNLQNWNPMLDWCKKMIFPACRVLEIKRPEKYGGDKSYNNYIDLEYDFIFGNIHPMDLKTGVARCLADWFAPILDLVKENPEILELVKNAKKLLK